MALFCFLLFLSFAQIMLQHSLDYVFDTKNGWLAMCGFCGVYFLFATLLEGGFNPKGCIGGVGYAFAAMFSFWALLTQIGFMFFNNSNKSENEIVYIDKDSFLNTPENTAEETPEKDKITGGDFWL